jgi:IS30 family transposase
MKKYDQLTQEQRYHIAALKKTGLSVTMIAEQVGTHKSTISRELRRNLGGRGYSPKQAQELSDARRSTARKYIKMTLALRKKIEALLRKDWSPDQISGYLAKNEGISISHERIYQHVLEDKKSGGELYKHLRHSSKKRKKRYGSHDRRGQIKNRISIEERPSIVDKKTRVGDWEIDTVIGKNHKGALVTIVDRVSKVTVIEKVATKQAEGVTDATIKALSPYADWVHTITADNGKEFAGHEEISKALDTRMYFAHPYSSWERGTNENTNGLIRQYVPKGSSFDNITNKTTKKIMGALNNRPRKLLNYSTPNEFLFKKTGYMIA